MPEVVTARRDLLRFLAASPLLASCAARHGQAPFIDGAKNLFDIAKAAAATMGPDSFGYLEGGADDERTVHANRVAFERVGIRCRRLVDVRDVDTRVTLFGRTYASPIGVSPVGFQGIWHDEGERAMGRACAATDRPMLLSSASTWSVGEVAAASGRAPWFQLYPTPDRSITKALLRRAEAAGCDVVALTVDTPIIGNRERHGDYLRTLLSGRSLRMGNYEGIRTDEPISDPSMTWDMVRWLREHTSMRVVLKGIVTSEDAEASIRAGADGVIISNHGGRQAESDRSTLECLPEVVGAIEGRIPVLLDGGVRRGTDVFKALALGANAITVGRPSIWGLAAEGEGGVRLVLDLLQRELVTILQLAGTPSLGDVTPDAVTTATWASPPGGADAR